METPPKKRGWISNRQFPELAARYSLIIPFATLAVSFVLVKVGQMVFHEVDAIVNTHKLIVCVFWMMTSSFLAGVVSLFGISRCGVRPIIWRALIGILASLLVGYVAHVWLHMDKFLSRPM